MNKVIRLGIVGCGNHMYSNIYHLLNNLPVKLVAACDVNEERLKRFTDKYSTERTYAVYKDMIEKESLDAVICIVNAQAHYEVARDCMLKGINVFVEKTPCMDAAQARELLEIQRKTNKYTMVGFNRRFATAYMMAREIIGRPEFGRTTMYLAKYNSSEYSSEDYYILNHVIHHLDIARYFLGEIEDIHTNVIRLSDKKVGFNISFVAESGAIGMIQSGSLLYEPYPMERIEISGVERNVVIDNVKRLEYNRPGGRKHGVSDIKLADGGDALVWNLNHGHSSLYSHYGFERELQHFIDSVINEKVPESNFEDIVHTMELYKKFKNSIPK